MTGNRVLAVDDEPRILRFVARALAAEGLEVDTAADGETALRMAATRAYDVVILDLVMPGTGGIHVLERLLRNKPGQAVVVLSCQCDTASKVRCLDMGAIDFLGKPFALEELLARVHARIRDRGPRESHAMAARTLVLDPVRQEANVGSRVVSLTRRESMLLAELVEHAGTAVSKQRLLAAVWGYYFAPRTNVLDVYVRRLRGKLGAEAISTVRGVGYGIDLD
jgi:two-component system, OmpR family, response regulator